MVTPPPLEALLVEILASGALHGYAVMAALRERSGGDLDFPEGTVYPALHRLERDGLAVSSLRLADGRTRRVYSLTDAGRSAGSRHREGWHAYSRAIGSIIGRPGAALESPA
jgi:DNA-binding PadR family transcriptional regulator